MIVARANRGAAATPYTTTTGKGNISSILLIGIVIGLRLVAPSNAAGVVVGDDISQIQPPPPVVSDVDIDDGGGRGGGGVGGVSGRDRIHRKLSKSRRGYRYNYSNYRPYTFHGGRYNKYGYGSTSKSSRSSPSGYYNRYSSRHNMFNRYGSSSGRSSASSSQGGYGYGYGHRSPSGSSSRGGGYGYGYGGYYDPYHDHDPKEYYPEEQQPYYKPSSPSYNGSPGGDEQYPHQKDRYDKYPDPKEPYHQKGPHYPRPTSYHPPDEDSYRDDPKKEPYHERPYYPTPNPPGGYYRDEPQGTESYSEPKSPNYSDHYRGRYRHSKHPNHGAFEGGPSGTVEDTKIHNVVQVEDQIKDRQFDIPTGGRPSPMEFNGKHVDAFSMHILRFEEFGQNIVRQRTWTPYHTGGQDESKQVYNDETYDTLPIPDSAGSFPDSARLEEFLYSPLHPSPTEYSNEHNQENPWKELIENYLQRKLQSPPMEGRPRGTHWKHQRWDEFYPKKYFKTATTGARTNTGMRYSMQSHGYSDKSEFGGGGLYADQTLKDVTVQFHPNLPIQKPDALWTFDGTFPPKLAMSKYGEPVLMRHYNALPVDVTANRGFGVHTLTTHEHNGHTPAESDGYTNAFFFPGQYYDYRWPMVLAGHDSINAYATDPRAGTPDGKGGIQNIPGDWRETMSTHWFHDHMLDFTAANVYKGDAAMHNIYSAIDRGNEAIDDGVNLRFPSGSMLDYGNRDYDINVLIADKAWDRDGQLWFNPHDNFGFLGDHVLTNWCYKPILKVRSRRYRFRLLNGAVSRYFKIALVTEAGEKVPMYMVANDGNIMEHSVLFDGILPTIGIAERYDIVVDFKHFPSGTKLYFVNMMQHKTGMSTDKIVPLEEILDGSYEKLTVKSEDEYGADPCVGKFMQMVVYDYAGIDESMDPDNYLEGNKKMIPLRRPTKFDLDHATHRTFELERSPDNPAPWGIGVDGGEAVPMDPHRVSAAVQKSATHMEVWRLVNSGSWSHPYHIHFEEAIIIRKNGAEPPPHEKFARKDVFRLGPDEDSAVVLELAYRFREFTSTFMGHCHNTLHEDHAMLMRWDIENPGGFLFLPSPIPFWEGVQFEDSNGVETARTGDATGLLGPQLEPVDEWLRNIRYGGFGPDGHQDLATMEIGDSLHFTEDERGWVDIPLLKGIMRDHNNRRIWFVLHDMSDEPLADRFGVAYAGGLRDIPEAALGEKATYDNGIWSFYGDLPNPVRPVGSDEPFSTNDDNTYSPYRRVVIDGTEVVVNAFFVKWGDNENEILRIDQKCKFPDHPPNTRCMYNGKTWGKDTGHFLGITSWNNSAMGRFKLHKSWAEEGDYIPYYIVVDSFPAGTANAMGIIYVPRHKHLGKTAVPLVQFLPGKKLRDSYPATPEDGHGLMGGGPLGGQIGLPSYFMPGEEYSPAWHIGFVHWAVEATEVVKSLDRVQFLRREGFLNITEFPPPVVDDNYDFENLNSPHVVNCPTPITIDFVIHQARAFEDKGNADTLV